MYAYSKMNFTDIFSEESFQKLLLGLLTIFTTFGAKYIYEDLDDSIENVLRSKWMRRLYIFGFVYLATQDFYIATLVLFLYLFFLKCCKKDNKMKSRLQQ